MLQANNRVFWANRLSQSMIGTLLLLGMWAGETVHADPVEVPDTLGTHDPSRIIEDDGYFYFYSTSGDLSGMYTADGGSTWQGTGPALPDGIPSAVHDACPTNDGHNIWAPDVIWNPNSEIFQLYYSCADWDDGTRSAIGLVSSPTLDPSTAEWTDQGVVIAKTPEADQYNAIDPNPFFDAEGNMWLSFGSGYGSTRETALNVIALDKSTGLRADEEVYPVQACGCEASYIQPHDGSYYLFYNTGGCCSGADSDYLIHVARASDVTGPYEDERTFYESNNSIHGPGHLGIITDNNGTDYFTYHYYPDDGGSVLGMGAITWTDGWPTVS